MSFKSNLINRPFSSLATDRTLTDNLADAREALINCAVDLLQTYKTLNPMESMNGLVASQATALLPLYISAILKHVSKL